ncbi:MAG: hypothetical protein JW751_04285 [Polyangiaceae bacterium]|nr:hypothetical protein [Polyangiaceae bacterium]
MAPSWADWWWVFHGECVGALELLAETVGGAERGRERLRVFKGQGDAGRELAGGRAVRGAAREGREPALVEAIGGREPRFRHTARQRSVVTTMLHTHPSEKTPMVLRLEDGRWSILQVFADGAKVRAEPFAAFELDLAVPWADVVF